MEAASTSTMSDRVFPIKVEPACLLKWSWSSIYLNSGSTNSCHRTERYRIDPDDFENFHNVPEKIRDRQSMLRGEWPGHGCEYCRNIEESGGVSDRQYQLSLQKDPCQHPPELNNNITSTSVTPTILEVYFTNTCNMKCVYCGPHFSSQWEEENRKFKNSFNESNETAYSVSQTVDNPHYDKMVADLWSYLEKQDRYRVLRRFHVLGGEPFLLKEMDAIIDFWNKNPNIDLLISIVTNLNIPHDRFVRYMARFKQLIDDKKIWKIQITASLDAWGDQQMYTRYGLDLDLWEKNFEYLVDKQWVTLSINSAISALTIPQMPILIDKINKWNSRRGPVVVTVDNVFGEAIDHSFNTTGRQDDPYIFGPGVFDIYFDEILKLMPAGDDRQKSCKQQMESIAKAITRSKKNQFKINKLKNYLDMLDQRRNTNWKKTFPWLVEI